MDWISINTGCFSVSNAISKTSPALRKFVREVRESRSELDAVLAELSSLDGVLEILKDDAEYFPPGLISRTPALLEHCTAIINQLEGYMHVCNGLGLTSREKKFRWMAIRQDLVKLKATLEGYKSTLGLASDLVGLRKARKENGKKSMDGGDNESLQEAADNQAANYADMKHELTRVMAGMGSLRARLQGEFRSIYAVSDMKSYLDAMQLYAIDMGSKLDAEKPDDEHSGGGSSVGDAPDSAIDMNEPHSPVSPTRTSKETVSRDVDVPIVEMDEFLDELKGLPQPHRAPTPPPKAVARTASMRSSTALYPPEPTHPAPSIRSVSDYGEMTDAESPAPQRTGPFLSTNHPEPEAGRSPTSGSIYSTATAIQEEEEEEEARDGAESCAPPAAIKDSRVGRRLFGRRNSFAIPGRPTRPGTSHSQTSPPTIAVSAPALAAIAQTAVSPETTPVPRPSTSLSTNAPSLGGSGPSIRSTSSVRRLSNAFRRVSLWAPKDPTPVVEDPEPNDIFGVSLKKSMALASATVRTHHSGSGSSKRDFPRCILSCNNYIRDSGGINAPHVFGEAGNLVRVAILKEAFATGPRYGNDLDWADFDVYDAAELIVLFLQQLPKPLVSETVARRWVMLSKQATLPGSLGMRLDSCIDFWDEALLGIRGAARSLFKLLLNLWGEVAEAADRNDMTAERLAGRLLSPLMHLSAGKYSTDYMLGLAFLIRKRSEYSLLLKGTGEKSKAAFEP